MLAGILVICCILTCNFGSVITVPNMPLSDSTKLAHVPTFTFVLLVIGKVFKSKTILIVPFVFISECAFQ